MKCLASEDGTERLSRNVCNYQSMVLSHITKDLIGTRS